MGSIANYVTLYKGMLAVLKVVPVYYGRDSPSVMFNTFTKLPSGYQMSSLSKGQNAFEIFNKTVYRQIDALKKKTVDVAEEGYLAKRITNSLNKCYISHLG